MGVRRTDHRCGGCAPRRPLTEESTMPTAAAPCHAGWTGMMHPLKPLDSQCQPSLSLLPLLMRLCTICSTQCINWTTTCGIPENPSTCLQWTWLGGEPL